MIHTGWFFEAFFVHVGQGFHGENLFINEGSQ